LATSFVVGVMSGFLGAGFAGFLFGLAVVGPVRPLGVELLGRAPEPLVAERVMDADRMCVRDLRRLPSIGPARSLAIVRARFGEGLRGGPEAWTRIGGIGPETVRAARKWMEGARLSGPRGGAYTSLESGSGSSLR
jgi:hypothetical protein